MALEWSSIPLAWVAGVLSILSPCVWPLVPIVMTSASGQHKWGALYLALGLSTSFALAGGVLTWVLLNLGLDPETLRWVSAALMLVIGFILVSKPLANWVSLKLSKMSSRLNFVNTEKAEQRFGQFGVGLLLKFEFEDDCCISSVKIIS